MKQTFILLLITLLCTSAMAQQIHKLSSPDGNIKIDIETSKGITYDVFCQGELVLDDCRLSMNIEGNVLGSQPKVQSTSRKSVNEVKRPFLRLKYAEVPNHYNELTLKMKGGYSVVFRAYNDGVAYRFVTSLSGEVQVYDEDITVFLPNETNLVLQQSNHYQTSYEERYTFVKAAQWQSHQAMVHYPILAITPGGTKILMSEADLQDYPGAFFRSNDANGFSSIFPRVPAVEKPRNDKSTEILLRKPYIALTKGTRNFPWRYFVISKNETDLVTNTMTCRLSQDSRLDDTSWIQPGQASWEWWNGAVPYGEDINFRAGLNVETYKYFMDFAAKYGIKYIVMDEGWAKDNMDPYTPNPDCDLMEILAHGKKVGVGVVLWLTWRCVEQNPGLFAKFAEWGVKGVKIDFMDRSDQWMVDYYERVAAEAAKHHLFVDFHGSFKPAGLEYKYPNVLSYEGVRGVEQNGGCIPDNSVFYPFMRNAVGPMDYTPGVILTYQPELYLSKHYNGGGIGTRAYQMALFVLFETGLQMLCDNPTLYYREKDCTQFMAGVPIPTDETISLAAKVGEYAIVAKRKGDKWYIGGMTNNKEQQRVFDLSLDFLPEGQTWKMISYEDGVNANKQAMHYMKREKQVKKGDKIQVKMARNGGFAAVLTAE